MKEVIIGSFHEGFLFKIDLVSKQGLAIKLTWKPILWYKCLKQGFIVRSVTKDRRDCSNLSSPVLVQDKFLRGQEGVLREGISMNMHKRSFTLA